MKKFLVLFLLLLPSSAYAQQTKTALTSEINTNFASGIGITASTLRATMIDVVNSYYDLAGGTSLACAAHQWVAGLPTLSSLTCTQPAIADISGWGTGVATALGININLQGGLISPTPSRNGDIIWWNNSTAQWTTLAGNNSGTGTLQENASGVPAFNTVAGTGTVTSITCGTGLSGGTITNAGTCAVSLTNFTNSLSGNTSLNNTANYFDGPSVAQGTSGEWFASGTVTLSDSAPATFLCKLWDGTTVIASTGTSATTTSLSLSGQITSPAGNIKISCRDSTATTGLIVFNASGNSKDSTITVHRIQ